MSCQPLVFGLSDQLGLLVEKTMKCNACKDRPKFWQGSDPKCAFAAGAEWSSDNWNCATTGLIRRLFDGAADGTLPDGVAYHWGNDQNTGMVCAQGLDSDDRPLSLWVTWYKSRGRTEQMWLMFHSKPPRRPTEAELVALAGLYSPNAELCGARRASEPTPGYAGDNNGE